MKTITHQEPDRQAKIRWPLEPRQPEFTFVRELPFALVYPESAACPEPVCPEPVEWAEWPDHDSARSPLFTLHSPHFS